MEDSVKPRISCKSLKKKIKDCPKLKSLFGTKSKSNTFINYLQSINCKCGNWCNK